MYCADDFSPVQTSSSAALHSPQYTLCYCSQRDELLLKNTQNPSEVWSVRDMSPLFFTLLSAGGGEWHQVRIQTKTSVSYKIVQQH